MGTRLTDRISNSRLYEKSSSTSLFRAIIRERFRWLGYVLRMNDDRLPNVVLFGQHSRAKRKAGRPCLEREDVVNRKISLRTKIRTLEATVMTVVKYGSEAWVLQNTDDLLDVFQINCIRTVLGTRLTDRISNSRLYEKFGLTSPSRAIIRERFRWLGYVLRMKDDRLPKGFPFRPAFEG